MKQLTLLTIALICAALAGCSDRSQDLEERVTQLKKELERTQAELQTAKQALATANETAKSNPVGPAAKSSAPPPAAAPQQQAASTTGLPSKEVLEDSYVNSAKALRKELDAKLKNFSVTTCTLHNVQMPEMTYPFTSAISLSLKAKTGQPYELEFPVKADATGKWVFPTVAEIVSRMESARTSTASAPASPAATAAPAAPAGAPAQAAAAPARPAAPGRPAPNLPIGQNVGGGAMPANSLQEGNATLPPASSTVVIQWGSGGSTVPGAVPAGQAAPAAQAAPATAAAGQPARQAQPAAAQPQQTPAGVMPSDRDVLIKF